MRITSHNTGLVFIYAQHWINTELIEKEPI